VKRLYIYVFIAIFSFIGVAKTNAQFKDFGLKGGLQINGVLPATEFEDRNGLALSSYMLRGFLRFELSDLFNGEFGVGYAKFSGNDYNNGTYESTGIPIDLRLLITPFDAESLNPYLYLGAGVLHLGLDKAPISVAVQGAGGDDGFYAHFPFGIGTEIKLSDSWLLDVAVGADYTLSERLNGYKIEDFNDAWFNVGVGITYAGESMNSDNDKDGLTKREELELGTDPDNPDTDGDGLKDGEEVKKYNTDPKLADTDGDGLKDGEEVLNYKTSPVKADTDGDGLNDFDEVTKHKTDPLKADTDGDGLNDGEEVNQYKTSPFKADTDGDGLNDGAEVKQHKTDPLKADTDGGSVPDGKEVENGTNPLDPSDDVAPKVVEKELSFDNILFGFDKSKLTKESQATLDAIYDALNKYSEAKITLSGHTDSIGSENYNMKLSEKRANVAKEYLIKKGLNGNLINLEWFGESKPVVPNNTATDRAKNRRTEVKAKVMEKK
jgi:outer membrane protein OmpA-like peptidoglycan-associated protein